MSGISGLNLTKKSTAGRAPPVKRKAIFGGDDGDSDEDDTKATKPNVEPIAEFDDLTTSSIAAHEPLRKDKPKAKNAICDEPPKLTKPKNGTNAMFGDLSSTRESRQRAEQAQALDPTIYDYDGVYDLLKPKNTAAQDAADAERAPKFMDSLMAAAAVRRRDALIAQDKKIAREREAEGDEYAGKETFVTEAYKKQQEENRRLEEQERRRQEQEAKKVKDGGMSAFYKKLLNKGEQRHSEVMKATEELARRKAEGLEPHEDDGDDGSKETNDADLARALNEKGGAVALNEDGQVVDKRQLLRGGLNVAPRPKAGSKHPQNGSQRQGSDHNRAKNIVGAGGERQAMRDRQTRMMEQQLEQALKRSRKVDEGEKEQLSRVTKRRKTEGDIESLKERYLRRKREAAEEANNAGRDQ